MGNNELLVDGYYLKQCIRTCTCFTVIYRLNLTQCVCMGLLQIGHSYYIRMYSSVYTTSLYVAVLPVVFN